MYNYKFLHKKIIKNLISKQELEEGIRTPIIPLKKKKKQTKIKQLYKKKLNYLYDNNIKYTLCSK